MPPVTREGLIEIMKDPNRPNTIRAILGDTGLSSGTLSLWIKKGDGFRAQYRMAMMAMKKKNKKRRQPSKMHTGWEDEWIEAYELCGGRFGYTCEVTGVDRRTVNNRLDPSSPLYDKLFVKKYEEAEQAVNRSLVDVAHKRALKDESDTMIKFLLMTKLPDQYGKTTTHQFNAKIEYTVIEERARKFLQNVFSNDIEGEFYESSDTADERGVLIALSADEGSSPGRHNGCEEIPLQERPLLSLEV